MELLSDVFYAWHCLITIDVGSICSGPLEFPGVFIKSIKPGSLAEEAGLGVGDQLIDVNGTSFLNITHSEVINLHLTSQYLYIMDNLEAFLPCICIKTLNILLYS